MNLQVVLQALYDSATEAEIAIRDEWDCGWQVRIGGSMEPLAPGLEEAARWLHEQAITNYPNSKYAVRLAELSENASQDDSEMGDALKRLYNSVDRVGVGFVAGKGWDLTFNEAVTRVASLQDAVQWLREREPNIDAIA